jgi:hypothetical protein
MARGPRAGDTDAMLNWFLHLQRTSLGRSDADFDAEALCIGIVLLALGLALI